MNVRTRMGALVALGLLAACADATPYRSSYYDEVDKGGGIWHVSYSANGHTTRETVQTYWLYRCAEFTLEKGYDGFEIVSRIRLARFESSPAHSVQLAASTPLILPLGPPPDSTMVHNTGADIRLLRAPLTPTPPRVFDAAALRTQLDAIVNGPKCEHGNVCPHPHDYLKPKEG